MKRFTLALAAAAAVSAVTAATAFAHVEVKSTYPGKGKTVSKNVSSVSVTFSGAIRKGTLKVTGPGGKAASNGSGGRDPRKVSRLRTSMKSGLSAGTYKAKWTMTAADGHTQSGTFTFKVK
jgi:methionine-rich copper-binding protein CopC